MTLKDRLVSLDRRLLPGRLPTPSSTRLWRAVLLYVLGFVLATALGLLVSVMVDEPNWLGVAVSAGAVGLLGAFLVRRLVQPNRE